MALILGIESTCDETAAAVVRDGRRVLSNAVATQYELHQKFRGVVPEIASRAHIENILPVIREATERAGVALAAVDAVSVTHRPGLIGSLLIGVTAAKTLAWVLGKPLVGVDHVHAHLYSVMLEDPTQAVREPVFPAVGLVVSGGHTALYAVRSFTDIELIGSTVDDAIGEAYDKVAAILHLPYPGGPPIDKLAQAGNAEAVHFPRTLLDKTSLDFSFSGLKTSVLYHVRGQPGRKPHPDSPAPPPEPQRPAPTEAELRDICASFQRACTDVVREKVKRAIRQIGARSVIVGGGVSANRGLREALATLPVPVLVPPLKYCTDNAAMSAGLADVLFAQGQVAPLSLDAITHSKFRDK